LMKFKTKAERLNHKRGLFQWKKLFGHLLRCLC
jgi:hypothetical protein